MFLGNRKISYIRTLFRSFKIKYNACISFNEDIFDYGNRKSDSIWVQIESLLAEREGFEPSVRD